MESISAKLERVDHGFGLMIFATFDYGATDETTVIMNQVYVFFLHVVNELSDT